MKKILKWTGILLGALILIVGCILLYFNMSVNHRLSKTYQVSPRSLPISRDSASVERGKYLAMALCTECHSPDLGGKVFFQDPQIGTVISANLTPGKGGIGSIYRDEDWVRAIRHGITPVGRPLLIMPAKDFNHLTAKDLSSLIGYLKTLSPIDRSFDPTTFTLMAKIILATGGFGDAISAEVIDHEGDFAKEVPQAVTPEYGHYLVQISGCRTCHGKDLNGAKDPNPQAPPSPNLTPTGHPGKWTPDQFISTMRTGKTPEGKSMGPAFMPWMSIGKLNDEDLKAMFAYLKTLKPMDDGFKK